MPETIYLAGPEVFLPNAVEVFERKKLLCEKYGFIGLAPLDNEVELDPDNPEKSAHEIYVANELAMDNADFCIANITPFRGISADPGTVYEIGYMRGIRKVVYGYSCLDEGYFTRVQRSEWFSGQGDKDINGSAIEQFGLIDNLMIPCGIHASRGGIVAERLDSGLADENNLKLFEKTLQLASSHRNVPTLDSNANAV